MSELDYFRFQKPDNVRRFRAGVRNIIAYGLGDRLTMIKQALMHLVARKVSVWAKSDGDRLT